MHKKFFVLVVAIALVTVGMGFGQKTQTFRMKVVVEKYIEVNPGYAEVEKKRTIPGTGDGTPTGYPTWAGNLIDAVYANCPFTITYEGTNDAGDPFPILARRETPNGNGWDRLQTRIHIKNRINEVGADPERHDVAFESGPDGANTGTWSTIGYCSGSMVQFNNAPHDGEVRIEWFFDGTLPHKSPDFGVDNTWNQSADAGEYSCRLIATYAAI